MFGSIGGGILDTNGLSGDGDGDGEAVLDEAEMEDDSLELTFFKLLCSVSFNVVFVTRF